MINSEELTEKVKEVIKYEREHNKNIIYTNESKAKLISQIISNYNLDPKKTDKKIAAKMIYLGAPTGAGKDILVKKLLSLEPDCNYIILNMDIFRHYHNEITGELGTIPDKKYAIQTNQSSYEIYYLIQEIVLREFPGTNIIVTGTMKDLDWFKNIIKRYKEDTKADYFVELDSLAVEKNESAFSIFERYLNLVDARDSLVKSLRFTDIGYYKETTRDFIKNVKIVENEMKVLPEDEKLINRIKVFRRSENIFDFSEDTILYDSDNIEKYGDSCIPIISKKMNSFAIIDNERIERLIEILKRNKEYLITQGLYKDILNALREILISQLDVDQDAFWE